MTGYSNAPGTMSGGFAIAFYYRGGAFTFSVMPDSWNIVLVGLVHHVSTQSHTEALVSAFMAEGERYTVITAQNGL